MLSMTLYLLAGSAGVPWFANHSHGWAGTASFGYIIGFVAAAGVVANWPAAGTIALSCRRSA